jgi:hypothetical protein
MENEKKKAVSLTRSHTEYAPGYTYTTRVGGIVGFHRTSRVAKVTITRLTASTIFYRIDGGDEESVREKKYKDGTIRRSAEAQLPEELSESEVKEISDEWDRQVLVYKINNELRDLRVPDAISLESLREVGTWVEQLKAMTKRSEKKQ